MARTSRPALTATEKAEVLDEVAACRDDPARFNATILRRGSYWSKQREICRSVVAHPVTLVPTGNAVGKTYVDAGLILWFLYTVPGCLVLATAPTQVQLEEVLWKEVERAHRHASLPVEARVLRSPLKIDLGGGWQALAYSTTQVERFSGHHAADLLAIVDEASGVEDAIYEAIASLNPSREVLTGNPLRPDGVFYDRCAAAAKNPLANLIQVSSLESPHIELERSPWGLADRTWLEKMRADYGEGSLWWTCHVLGLFPDSGVDAVIPASWLDRAAEATHWPAGPRRIAIDLAEGRGGDRSVVLVRDDNGLVDLWSSTRADFQATATRVSLMAQRWSVEDHHVSFDVSGIGADFANRLQALGIRGARPFRGGNAGGHKFANLRSAAAWRLRQRLDPERRPLGLDGRPGPAPVPFAIRADWLRGPLREELSGLRYDQDDRGRIRLEPKEDFTERLKRSPDLADALLQSFGLD